MKTTSKDDKIKQTKIQAEKQDYESILRSPNFENEYHRKKSLNEKPSY